MFTTADTEIVVHLEAQGTVVNKVSAEMRYSLRLPVEAVAARECVVCGVEFTPHTSQVKTCGRSCGGKSKGTPRMAAPTCPDCGRLTSGKRRCRECHSDHGTVQALLRKIGVPGNKHIPATYLRASVDQRRALLCRPARH
ncbi:hypothetical protein LP422_20990 [Janibacter limosus]|uniref:Uncharacterized protein n=1 Tax=Janibacter limosus TaxID=53458 RepID=A0AC61U433_9MICO|nr:hypothetical protein [Janibacter limosus]UUZ44745.1 hypothetical protein LP422_20990 [Janibacter limosus]